MASRIEKKLRDQMIDSMLYANPEAGVDVLFSFDTTGSMYACLAQVRNNIADTARELIEMGHGDYCDSRLMDKLDFTDDVNKIVKFVQEVPATGGGDYPEAYEYVLQKAQEFKWRPECAKALVLIGDAPPHPPSYTDQLIWWRDELTKLYRLLGVKIYAVQAYPGGSSFPFYQECARRTGGVYLELRNFNLITEMFKAVCYREKGVSHLQKYRKRLTSKLAGLDEVLDKLEHDQVPAALRANATNDWWQLENDNGHQRYVLGKSGGKNAAAFGKSAYTGAKFESHYSVHGSTVVKKKKLSEFEEMDNAAKKNKEFVSTDTSRVGSRILDTPNPTKPASFVTPVKSKPVHYDPSPYIFAEVGPKVFKVVLRDSPEGQAQLEKEALESASKPSATAPQQGEVTITKSAKDAALILTKDQQIQNAKARLMRDWKEVKGYPLPSIVAEPLESNIMEWHCNLVGPAGSPYAGVVFHLILKFPDNYPRKPPAVVMCSKLHHDNVFGKWLCLDMLELGSWGSGAEMDRAFTGWSYGYSVLSVLLQLQAVLFEGAYQQAHFVKEAMNSAAMFECKECGHVGKRFELARPEISKDAIMPVEKTTKTEVKANGHTKPANGKKTDTKTKATPQPSPATPKPVTTTTTTVKSPQFVAYPKPSSINSLKVGQNYIGLVLRVKDDLGAFIDLGSGIIGLLHITQMTDRQVRSGESVMVWIRSIDLERGKISLTTTPLQLSTHLNDLKEGDVRAALVRRVQSHGAYVDIAVIAEPREQSDRSHVWIHALLENNEIAGYWHVWSANDVLKEGDRFYVKVTKIDREARKVWVSSKALEKTPTSAPAGPNVTQASLHSKDGNQHLALSNSSFSKLSLHEIYNIMKYINPITAEHLGNTCKFFNKVTADGMSYLWERNELICFYSKRHFTEDVLGVGLNLENKLNGKLAYITTTFDLVSYSAFMTEKVRKAVYKEPFTHWLPLYINKNHAEQSIPLATEAMAKICKDTYGHFEPWMVIEVIPKLMNSMVVSVMSGKLHASVMALEGYCAFHHLFLMFLEVYPELKQKVDETIKIFLSDSSQRHKKVIPSLGEWIPLLTVTENYAWRDVAVSYLLEMFDRNVLWTLKKCPELVEWKPEEWIDQKLGESRLRKTFESTTVSNHLIMFHVYFLDNVARPEGVTLKQVREMLDLRYGKPTFPMKDRLMRECKKIRAVSNWGEFFKYLHMPAPSQNTMLDWLYAAQQNSARVKYHRPWDFERQIEEKKIEAAAKKAAKVAAKKVDKLDYYDDKYGY